MKYTVGIDFGTSTTMVKAKISDKTKKENLECKSVTFTQTGIPTTPTLIRKKETDCWYGHKAEQQVIPNSQLYSNFKLDLLNETDSSKKMEAIQLIHEFFHYLFACYNEQKGYLFGNEQVEEETKVSYPAQWNEELREVMIDSAKKAGFKNVIGVDEATAAVHCILKAKQKELEQKGYLKIGRPLHMLVIDMGAGTTDLAFVDVMIDNKNEVRTDILKTWPPIGNERRFGGRQIDEGLEQLLIQWLIKSGMPDQVANNMVLEQRNNIKAWKENTISVSLEREESVTDFPMLSMIVRYTGVQPRPFPSINKNTFATTFNKELSDFVGIINSAPKELLEQTELVILTGGNSLWYWIDDILLGRNKNFGEITLKQIIGQPSRVLRMELPAETVSRGLVYGAEIKPIIERTNNSTNIISNSNIPVMNKTALMPKVEQKQFLTYDPTSTIRPIIAISDCNFFAVKQNGKVIKKENHNHSGQCNVNNWNNIIAIACGGNSYSNNYTVGLKQNGTVVATGYNENGKKDLNNWKNIIAIACGNNYTVGLKQDGTVVTNQIDDGYGDYVRSWKDIIAITCRDNYTIGLKQDGTVVTSQIESEGNYIRNFKNVIAIFSNSAHIVALQNDGTIIGDNTTIKIGDKVFTTTQILLKNLFNE